MRPAPLLVAKPSYGLGAQGALVRGMILMPLGWVCNGTEFGAQTHPSHEDAQGQCLRGSLSPLLRHREAPYAWRRSPQAAWAPGSSVSRHSAEAPSWCHEVFRSWRAQTNWEMASERCKRGLTLTSTFPKTLWGFVGPSCVQNAKIRMATPPRKGHMRGQCHGGDKGTEVGCSGPVGDRQTKEVVDRRESPGSSARAAVVPRVSK